MIFSERNICPIALAAVLLFVAACKNNAPVETVSENISYTCSMDPQVMEKHAGTCPICKMDLVRVEIAPNQKTGELKLSKQQIQLANIQTDTVCLRPLGDEITLPAVLKENQNNIHTITARVPGRIERLYVRNAGEPVRAGQAVFELYSEQLAAAQQDYLLALQSKKRYTDPVFARIADAARHKLLLWGMNEPQIGEIEASGQAKNTLIFYSPYTGIATEVSTVEGDYVAEGSQLLRLADLRNLWVEAQLYVSDLSFLNQSKGALLEIPSFPERRLWGNISFVNPALETASKIVMVRTELTNPNGDYQPGMQAWMTLKGKARNAIAVPTNALIQGKEGSTVWLQNAEGAFEHRMVTTGKTNRDFTEIIKGLEAGETVVTSGAYLLHSELVFKKGANPMEGHEMGGHSGH